MLKIGILVVEVAGDRAESGESVTVKVENSSSSLLFIRLVWP